MVYMPWSETQQLRQKWVWILFGFVFLLSVATGLYPFIHGDHSGNAIAGLILQLSLPVIIMAVCWYIRLETTVDIAGISYRFFPLTGRKTISWDDIAFAWVRKYKPLAEYGGWGIRYSLGKNGKAINMRGDMGLQLVLKNGSRILIGTQQPEAMQQLLETRGLGQSAV